MSIDRVHVNTERYPTDVATSARYLWAHRPDVVKGAWPRVAVLILGDGRDAIRNQTIRSFLAHVTGYKLAAVVEVDDRRHELGFCGAIQTGWRALIERERWNRSCGGDGGWEYVFHLEEDWLFNRAVSLHDAARLMEQCPDVVQVALKRGPVNAVERAAGGLVEMWPDAYHDGGVIDEHGSVQALFHSLFWTTNPCLYRMGLLAGWEWPDGPGCEAAFTAKMLESGRGFAYLGERGDAPWITHNGARTGMGY